MNCLLQRKIRRRFYSRINYYTNSTQVHIAEESNREEINDCKLNTVIN